MDEKLNQAADNPATATDQAPEESSSQAPTAAVEQGADTAAANAPTSDSIPQTDVASSEPEREVEMTMEQVLAASDEQLARKPVHRGMITNGSVIMLSQDGIVVDVGAKIEGILPYNQLFEFETNATEAAKYFKPGDEIQVYVIRSDIPNNTIVLSKKRADQERAWNLLQDIFEKQKPVEVEIVEKVRGGLVANLGIRAFLPASQADVRRVNDLAPFVGKRLKVKIIELNRKRNRVIISRRSILEEEIAGQKEETLKKLEPGLRLDGEIVEITDFGAFVNLGGIDGLVHRSELSHGRFNHPREVINVGDKVRVEVLDMDLERERINLSMKKLLTNPWEDVLANYHIGNRVAGKVTNLTPFGAFVEIEPGLEGLIHVSEMSWTKRVRHPKEVVTEGDEVEAMILKIDTNQQRISLGLRQTQPDPWSSLPDRFPPGTEVTGPITGITEFGVFMEIEEGIEGLVHISELAHEHIEDISEHFGKGDEVTAVILNIDPVEQRASLSRKRLLPFSAGEFEGEIPSGAPAARGAARRGGRRGGRRSQGIDYDYSYAATDASAKTTTKLGDVYADLFAQFGLAEGKDDKDEESGAGEDETATASAESGEGQQEAAPRATQEGDGALTAGSQEESVAAESSEPENGISAQAEPSEPAVDEGAQAAAQVETSTDESKPEPQAAAEDASAADEENAIDAAEAAALLTAAFREGKRPVKPQSNNESNNEPNNESNGQSAERTEQEKEEEKSNA
ncbi:MAG: 30S ribosomal protein S1 [Trueperaceae bacterium]